MHTRDLHPYLLQESSRCPLWPSHPPSPPRHLAHVRPPVLVHCLLSHLHLTSIHPLLLPLPPVSATQDSVYSQDLNHSSDLLIPRSQSSSSPPLPKVDSPFRGSSPGDTETDTHTLLPHLQAAHQAVRPRPPAPRQHRRKNCPSNGGKGMAARVGQSFSISQAWDNNLTVKLTTLICCEHNLCRIIPRTALPTYHQLQDEYYYNYTDCELYFELSLTQLYIIFIRNTVSKTSA